MTHFHDKTWPEWSGATQLTGSLSKYYDVRKVACYKGINVVPDVFKYVVLIELCIEIGDTDTFARDCMQRFRINRMSGYAAMYQDYHTKDIEQAIDETQSLGAIRDTLD